MPDLSMRWNSHSATRLFPEKACIYMQPLCVSYTESDDVDAIFSEKMRSKMKHSERRKYRGSVFIYSFSLYVKPHYHSASFCLALLGNQKFSPNSHHLWQICFMWINHKLRAYGYWCQRCINSQRWTIKGFTVTD